MIAKAFQLVIASVQAPLPNLTTQSPESETYSYTVVTSASLNMELELYKFILTTLQICPLKSSVLIALRLSSYTADTLYLW